MILAQVPVNWYNKGVYLNGTSSLPTNDPFRDFLMSWIGIKAKTTVHLGFTRAGYNPPSPKGVNTFTYHTDTNDITPTMSTDSWKTKFSNKDFERRCREGEIIVSDYDIGACTYVYTPVFVPSSSPTTIRVTFSLKDLDLGLEKDGVFVMFEGNRYHGRVEILFNYYRTGHFQTSSTVPSMAMIKDSLLDDAGQIDPAVVQSVLSEANSGSLDLLTSLAELPETLLSIKDICVSIGNLYVAAKRRELYLTDQSMKKSQRLRAKVSSIEQELGELNNLLSSFNLSRLDRNQKLQLRKLRRRKRNLLRKRSALTKQLFDFAEELTSAIAGVWMNYRYNLLPNKYMIEDIIDTLENYKREFIRFRDGYTLVLTPKSVLGFEFSSEATVKHRAFIKRSYDFQTLVDNLTTVLRTNIAVTAWELLKRSFVVDWFFTIGDAISALLYNTNYHLEEGATVSCKIAYSGTLVHEEYGTIDLRYSSYQRDKIEPTDFIGIYYRPNVDLVRQLDAASMIWGTFRSDVRTRINGLKTFR